MLVEGTPLPFFFKYHLILCLDLVDDIVNYVRIFILGGKTHITPQCLSKLFHDRKLQESPLPEDILGPVSSIEQWHPETLVCPSVLTHIFFSFSLQYFPNDHFSSVLCYLLPGVLCFRTPTLIYLKVCLKDLSLE